MWAAELSGSERLPGLSGGSGKKQRLDASRGGDCPVVSADVEGINGSEERIRGLTPIANHHVSAKSFENGPHSRVARVACGSLEVALGVGVETQVNRALSRTEAAADCS
jgi:hypothetical protein